MLYTLFFTAQPNMCRYVEACMCGCAPCVTVIVCKSLWCDHLWSHSAIKNTLHHLHCLPHFHTTPLWLCDTVAPCVCVCQLITRHLKISKHKISHIQFIQTVTISVSCMFCMISLPDIQTGGKASKGGDRVWWARTDSLASGQHGHLNPSTLGDLKCLGYGWKFFLDHFRWSMGSGQW